MFMIVKIDLFLSNLWKLSNAGKKPLALPRDNSSSGPQLVIILFLYDHSSRVEHKYNTTTSCVSLPFF